MDYLDLYKRNVVECMDKYKFIEIDEDYVKKIDELAGKISAAKKGEPHHKYDNSKSKKRFLTGLFGEAALEKLLGIKIIDWSVGNSNDFNKPDIPGYSLGIKTVESKKFPVIFKKNWYPQIICIRSTKLKNTVLVCGIADIDTLNKYQSDDLIIDPKLRARGTKTGFYGFKYLKPIHTIDDIKKYKK